MESRESRVERGIRGRAPVFWVAGLVAVMVVLAGIAHRMGIFTPEARALESAGSLVGLAGGEDFGKETTLAERELPRIQSAEYDPSRDAAVESPEVAGAREERDRLRIRGRVLSALGREPVELANVSFRRYLEATPTEPERLEIRKALCDETGAFELEIAPPHPKNFQLRAEAPGFGAVDASFSLKEWWELKELSLILLGEAREIQLLVLDEGGAPVQASLVQVEPDSSDAVLFLSKMDGLFGCASHDDLETNAAGRLVEPLWLLPGTWKVGIEGYELTTGAELSVALGSTVLDHTVRVRRLQRVELSLRCVDEAGMPLSGVELMATFWAGRFFMDSRESDTEGRVRFATLDQKPLSQVRVETRSPQYEPIGLTFPFGPKEHTIFLKRLAELQLDLEMANPERLAALPRLRILPQVPGQAVQEILLQSEDSRRFIGHLPAGAHRLDILLPPGSFVPPGPFAVDAKAGERIERVIALEALVPRELFVRHEGGAPAVGCQVQLYLWRNPKPERMPELLNGSLLQGQASVRLEERDSQGEGSELLLVSSGLSDDTGRFELRGSAADAHVLRLTAKGHLEILVDEVRCGEGMSPLMFTLNPGAGLRGRIGPAAALPQLGLSPRDDFPGQASFHANTQPQVIALLRGPDGISRASGTTEVQEDGTFQLQGLPEGRYDLRLFIHDYRLETTGPAITHVFIGLAENLELLKGPFSTMTWDLSSFVPAPVQGRILFDGKPLARARVYCSGKTRSLAGPPIGIMSPPLVTGDDGRFETSLWPGTYQLLITGQNAVAAAGGVDKTWTSWTDAEPFTVRSGQLTRVERSLSGLAIEVRLNDKEGRPRQGFLVTVIDVALDSWSNGPTLATDAEGRVRFEQLLAGPKVIRTEPKEDPSRATVHTVGDLRPPSQSLTLVHEE